jgi:2-polyprenyl-3-methyl-5-hydroxy-6-metoxy-1,4-benzoquinol methylase
VRLNVDRCPVCGSGDPGRAMGGIDLVQCLACATIRSREVADPSELYSDGYHDGADGRFVSPHPLFAAYVERVHRDRLALLGRVIRPPGRLVDVGCGDGGFLVAARVEGWRVAGVEPVGALAVRRSAELGIDIRSGSLPVPDFGDVDVVTALHVLEHVPDPVDLLRQLVDVVRGGGIVTVEVPNFGSAARRVLGGGWSLLQPDEHITHFTAASLRRAFAEAGLGNVVITSPSWVGPPQARSVAARDLGLRRPYPWPVLRLTEQLRRRALTGQVLFATARTPG